uniref:Sperm associated antigen 8 n=1 Tax=Molossus molossus TaxID=27622 RepID=A0A7J8EGS7_MOLMO|nr:sperm associated antigen 8 [Molossus molossus]
METFDSTEGSWSRSLPLQPSSEGQGSSSEPCPSSDIGPRSALAAATAAAVAATAAASTAKAAVLSVKTQTPCSERRLILDPSSSDSLLGKPCTGPNFTYKIGHERLAFKPDIYCVAQDPCTTNDLSSGPGPGSSSGPGPDSTSGPGPGSTSGPSPGFRYGPDPGPGFRSGPVPGSTSGPDPGSRYVSVPGSTAGPVPGSRYGPVPGSRTGPVPGSRYGPVPGSTAGPDSRYGPVPGSTSGPVPGSTAGPGPGPGSRSGPVPGSRYGPVPGSRYGPVPGFTSDPVPGSTSGAGPGSRSGPVPGCRYGPVPGSTSGADPGSTSGADPGSTSGADPGSRYGPVPGSTSGPVPGSTSGAGPGSRSGPGPGSKSGPCPGSTSGPGPGSSSGPGPGSRSGPGHGSGPGCGSAQGTVPTNSGPGPACDSGPTADFGNDPELSPCALTSSRNPGAALAPNYASCNNYQPWEPQKQPWKFLPVSEPAAQGLWKPSKVEEKYKVLNETLPRGRCLLYNWEEERATNHLDQVPSMQDGSESFYFRHGHQGLLTLQLQSPLPLSTTQKDSYQPPRNQYQPIRGKREAMLEMLLCHQICKEVQAEQEQTKKHFEVESVTHHDYQKELVQAGPPAPTKPHDYCKEQPETFWIQRAPQLPGVSNIKTLDTPFRKNCSFSTPVPLSLGQPLPYEPENYPHQLGEISSLGCQGRGLSGGGGRTV